MIKLSIARMAELAYAADLKSAGHSPWEFESPSGYFTFSSCR